MDTSLSRSRLAASGNAGLLLTLQKQICAFNNGDVYLTENAAGAIVVTPASQLPRQHDKKCAFHSNVAFARAAAAGEPAAVFSTPSGNVLVVPTAPYTSIRDFAFNASPTEFAGLFLYAQETKEHLTSCTGKRWYLETIGHDVAHLHIRLVRKRVHMVRQAQPSR